MDVPTAEQLKEFKEVAVAAIAFMSLLVNGLFGYLQSKCRRDLDLAYGEIRYMTNALEQLGVKDCGTRVIRKPGQWWRRKKNRKLQTVKPIEKEVGIVEP